jgi:acetolactate decarboxylase
MAELKCTLSTGLWGLLQARSQRTHEPPGHIVSEALAAYFDVAHHTMYQVSTATALVEGIYQGAVRVGVLREHGDLGLGTFADLDGEFAPEPAVKLGQCPDMGRLTARFDTLRRSDNVFFALRVDGQFDYVHTRAMCRTNEGVSLVQAAAVQPEFEFHNIKGTLVGFWTPEYAKTSDQISPTIKKALKMQGPVIIGVPVDYRDNHEFMEMVHLGALN